MLRTHPIQDLRNTLILLNSWVLLATIGSDFHQSQALSRSYSSNWPNSLNYYISMAIGYTPRRPDAVIRYGKISPVILVSWTIPTALDSAETEFCHQ